MLPKKKVSAKLQPYKKYVGKLKVSHEGRWFFFWNRCFPFPIPFLRRDHGLSRINQLPFFLMFLLCSLITVRTRSINRFLQSVSSVLDSDQRCLLSSLPSSLWLDKRGLLAAGLRRQRRRRRQLLLLPLRLLGFPTTKRRRSDQKNILHLEGGRVRWRRGEEEKLAERTTEIHHQGTEVKTESKRKMEQRKDDGIIIDKELRHIN